MSFSFSAVNGFNTQINLGDAGYNSKNYDKNKVYTNGNPTLNNSINNANIKRDPSKSVHTRHIEKVGSETLSNLNRNTGVFNDRMQGHINTYATKKNVMATGVDYGGNPYKIGDSSKTCKFNLGDYITMSQEFALSRTPVRHISSSTNKRDTFVHTSNINKNPSLKSIKDEYLNTNVVLNKKEKYSHNTNNLSIDTSKHIINDKIHYKVDGQHNKINNYNNVQNRRVDSRLLNENYQAVQASTNFKSNLVKDDNKNSLNPEKFLSENYRISNVSTNLTKNYNELDRQVRTVKLADKLTVKEGYSNNREGLRKQTENLNYTL